MFNSKNVWVAYKPDWCNLKIEIPHNYGYYLFPIWFFMYYFKIGKILFSICLKYQIGTILIHNTYVAVIGGVLRKMGMARRMIYFSGDWLAGSKTKIGAWSGAGSNIIFPIFDYMACKFSDLTLNCTGNIAKARRKFWGGNIAGKERVFRNKLQVKSKMSLVKKTKFVFIGSIRKDSGLELCIKSLKDIRENFDARLKIIGPVNRQTVFLKNMVRNYGVEEFVEFLGFVQRSDFNKELADCFCGISLQTGIQNYSSETLPAKIYDCLQYLLPVVITSKATSTVKEINNNKLGIIVKPDSMEITKNIIKVYNEQTKYRNNIVEYINRLPDENISQFFYPKKKC